MQKKNGEKTRSKLTLYTETLQNLAEEKSALTGLGVRTNYPTEPPGCMVK